MSGRGARALGAAVGAACLAAMAAVLAASCASAQHVPDPKSPVAVAASGRTVELLVTCAGETAYQGLGVLVEAGAILTAGHLFGHADCKAPVDVLVLDRDGNRLGFAKVEGVAEAVDIALLSTTVGKGLGPVCTREPVIGEAVLAAGFPAGEYTITEGTVGKVSGIAQQDFSAVVAPGSSGGGVWAASDQCLVGVVSAYHVGDKTGVMVPVPGAD